MARRPSIPEKEEAYFVYGSGYGAAPVNVAQVGTAAGSSTAFATPVDSITLFAPASVWLAKTATAARTAATGALGGRFLVPANAHVKFSWKSRALWACKRGTSASLYACGWI